MSINIVKIRRLLSREHQEVRAEAALASKPRRKWSVQAMAENHGATIIAEYVEVETGKNRHRPKLLEAIHHARLDQCDAGGRQAGPARSQLLLHSNACCTSKQTFVCCDNPYADDFNIDLLAVIAEHEAGRLRPAPRRPWRSRRRTGKLLGSARPGHWDGREDRRAFGQKKSQPLGSAANAQRARDRYQRVLVPEIKRRREAGESLVTITAWLNEQGFKTRPTKRCPRGQRLHADDGLAADRPLPGQGIAWQHHDETAGLRRLQLRETP